ncbi:polysaccharide pyruvyl transferase family protein [Micromonospora sp. NPDC050980]|uniref:polysaccharide pyruvyl transferase family protein n=1 Tax=Micromonospora sp. NPDC050980 TaxID=3155161 RepID=UPI0033C84ACE
MPPHVIISGVTSCQNRGVEALVRCIIEGLGTFGSWRATVLTQTPEQDAALLALPEAECVADPFVVSRSLRTAPPEPEHRLAARRERLIASADLVVTTGGDLHTADYGVSTKYLAAPVAAHNHNVPVAMLAHSIGPFSDPAEAEAWCATAQHCAVLTIRETISRRYVVNDLALSDKLVTLAADPAFLLAAAPPEHADGLLTEIGVPPGCPYVCLAPSKGIAALRGLSERQHMSALMSLISCLVSRWRLPILLLPHVHDTRPHNDDRRLVADLAQNVAHPLVRAVPGALNAAQYKAITARSVLTVAERMHAAIAALSSGVPTVTIGYSQKFLGILSDAYGDTIPLDQVHLGVESFITDDKTAARIGDGIDLEPLRSALANRGALIRTRARSNFARVADTLGAHA